MDLRQIEHFVAVAEDQHFTRAARRLNIVQSGLSASIRALETQLGAPLFVRSTRRVDLTAAGTVFLAHAKRMLAAARDGRDAVADVQGLVRGRLAIGLVQSPAPFLDLPDLLATFHSAHPSIEIHLCQAGSAHMIEKLRDGRVDIAFVPLFGEAPEGMATEIFACEPLVLVCAPDHALAGSENVALAALASETFVDFQPDWSTRRLVDAAFLSARSARRVAFEVNDLATLLDLVARGLGVALMPRAIASARAGEASGPALAIVELAGPEICWELALLHVADPRPGAAVPVNAAARAFLGLFNAALSRRHRGELETAA
ncbi:LysR substrate-binding domain-containing protein [Kaistia dalseonensis]|uniref:DNA-binding transcriptional LysR family regulator n=1 Tax=Kaistia dalseonensis TaxID=410840 RepID=A0ABU0HBX6_9HYPH|nr:LysR substrate-binding domain-containing protein [Kaistia dalseonensis]MCX5496856.1 LysR substrate-binding domain-containing protein [Kaistia dalseonensis]MDQ0439482.1 DNA-binding transcriptional LysR family regulator [Kaistia dalseonensis]